MKKALKSKLDNIKKYCATHKTQLIILGGVAGYSALWFAVGHKVGRISGLKEGIAIGAQADVDFIRSSVPEAARLVESFVRSNPSSVAATDEEFVATVIKNYSGTDLA